MLFALLAIVLGSNVASAQVLLPAVSDNAQQLAVGSAQFDLGTRFLERMGREAAFGYAGRDNSGGGGASVDLAQPTYRSWVEGYGISAKTGAQGTFVGDKRTTGGGVAGIGMTVAPGFSLGVSVDQSRTNIDVPLALQSAKLDLTQIGINGAYTTGNWTAAFAAVHGFASIEAQRATISGAARSNYGGSINGFLGELSYYYAIDQSRIVPKLGVEFVTASTNGYAEIGGTAPVTVGEGSGERARALFGAEVGHYWIVGQQIIDVSGYGKFVDNFSQSLTPVNVSLGAQSIAVQGVRESTYGADTGASVSWIVTKTARLYANYDGKFRGSGTNSQQGTLGLELKW